MPQTTTAYLLLDVAGTGMALARADTRAILPLAHLHIPPAAGGALAGFMNLAGVPVPVLDLGPLLGLRGPQAPDVYWHVVLLADGRTGLLVDRVMDVVGIEPDTLRPVGDELTLNGCVNAEIALGDRLIHVLAPERLLGAQEAARVAALTRLAAERLASLPSA